MKKHLRIISLGWGVQSFTLAVMAALGELQADYAVHADTTHEHTATYEFAKEWTPWLEQRGLPVVTTSPNARDSLVVQKHRPHTFTFIPVFGNGGGQLKRQCTGRWKIRPMRSAVRSLPEFNQQLGVTQLLGISTDEWQRAKDSDVKYITNEYPLLDLDISRMGCIEYLTAKGIATPPKSSCVFCPYHNKDMWKRLRNEGGSDWERAVKADDELRNAIYDRRANDTTPVFIHQSRVPLAQAVGNQLELPMLEPSCDSGYCFT